MIKKDKQADVLICAFRYALGRRSYITGTIVDAVMEAWDELSIHDRLLIKHEIKEAIKAGTAGDNIDVRLWREILNHE